MMAIIGSASVVVLALLVVSAIFPRKEKRTWNRTD